ncbi:helix-turn-helix transcriptional regulator [Colwellia sp. MB02u-14]|uniref:helix-turn-helix transcriptional regulator n=1 Tax=Colwellia sp. MB02u-14 TaxID=2759815 RepID=UPI0015F6A06F|nr:helix-turn-helix transcriptional regulator [Colwellia sp. MB02u-14]
MSVNPSGIKSQNNPCHQLFLSCASTFVRLYLNQAKAMALAKNTAAYLQSKLDEDIKLSELIVKMRTNRNKLNDAFKTSYGLIVFTWLLKKRMLLGK